VTSWTPQTCTQDGGASNIAPWDLSMKYDALSSQFSGVTSKVDSMANHMREALTRQRGLLVEMTDKAKTLDSRTTSTQTAHNMLHEAHCDLEARFQALISTLSQLVPSTIDLKPCTRQRGQDNFFTEANWSMPPAPAPRGAAGGDCAHLHPAMVVNPVTLNRGPIPNQEQKETNWSTNPPQKQTDNMIWSTSQASRGAQQTIVPGREAAGPQNLSRYATPSAVSHAWPQPTANLGPAPYSDSPMPTPPPANNGMASFDYAQGPWQSHTEVPPQTFAPAAPFMTASASMSPSQPAGIDSKFPATSTRSAAPAPKGANNRQGKNAQKHISKGPPSQPPPPPPARGTYQSRINQDIADDHGISGSWQDLTRFAPEPQDLGRH